MTIRQMCAGMYNFYKFFYSNKNNYKNNLNKNNYAQKNYGENLSELKKSAEKIKNLDLSDENSVAEVKNFLSEYNKNSTAKNNYESKIYENRPIFCNVELGYEKIFSKLYSEDEFLKLNYEACNKLKAEFFTNNN